MTHEQVREVIRLIHALYVEIKGVPEPQQEILRGHIDALVRTMNFRVKCREIC